MSGVLEQLIEALNANTAALKAAAGGAATTTAGAKDAAKTKAPAKEKAPAVTPAQASAKVTEVKEKFGADAARASLMVDGKQLKLAEVNATTAEAVLKQAQAILDNGFETEEEEDDL